MHKLSLMEPMDGLEIAKQPKLVQKNNEKFVYCTSFDCFG